MEKIPFKQVKEEVYHEKLENGLNVYLLPKKGFHKTFAIFTTKYGSVDNRFIPLGQKEWTTVPDGIAHFLEHKLFEKEDGDVFFKFGEKGAFTNAFTSFTKTAYLFSSTTNVSENLETLIDFVQQPYFTKETVEKEKGIIGQEIRMYDDDADFRVYFGAIENMYHNHPVKIDIAGTVESIAEIDKDLLYLCYNTFYHPNNMVLFVVGNLEPETMMEKIKANQASKKFAQPEEIKRDFPEEPGSVAISERKLPFSVKISKNLVGIKEDFGPLVGFEGVKHEVVADVALEMLFGTTSDNYLTLYNQGIIDDTFGYDYTNQASFSFVLIGGDAKNPDKQKEAIIRILKDSAINGLDQESLELVRKKRIGGFLQALNSPEFIANKFTQYVMQDASLFDVLPALNAITLEDVNTFIKSLAKEENRMTSFQLIPEK